MKTDFLKRSRGMSQIIDPEDDSIALRSSVNTDGFHYFKQEQQLKKYKKMVKEMQGIIKEQRQKREELQQKVQMLSVRNIMREKQFHNILKANLDIIKRLDNSDEEASNVQIMKVFDKIFSNFQDMNNATSTFIQNRYHENMKTMDTRISHIMLILNDEIAKTNKIRNIDRLDLQRKIEQVIHIAKKIEQENFKNKQKIESNDLKNRLLQEQKQLLIQQVVQKKQLILKLYLENKKLKQQKQTSQNYNFSSPEAVQKKSVMANTERTYCESYDIKSTRYKAEQKSKKESPIRDLQASKNEQFITESYTKNYQSGKMSKGRYTSAKVSSKVQRTGARSLYINKSIQQEAEISKNKDYQKTIEHLKLSLEREKKKCQQTSRLLNRLQFQNQEVNASISQIIKEYKKNNKDEKALEVLVKSEKLFEIIRSLKQRLSMVERPSFSCGWGENPVEGQLFPQTKQNANKDKNN